MIRIFLNVTLSCLLLILVVGSPARAVADDAGFGRGNTLYAAGDFAGAAGAYEAQVKQGNYSANLFYNLADAYYRQNDRGRALLNYQRALILDPSHAEAAANLAFVRGQRPITPMRAAGLVDALSWLAAAAGWLAVAGVAVFVLRARWRNVGLTSLAAGTILCAAGIFTIRSLDDGARDPRRAVVVADNAPALYAPADNSKVITTLTAGGEIRVLSDQGAWVYALLTDGTRAWVASNKLERVVP